MDNNIEEEYQAFRNDARSGCAQVLITACLLIAIAIVFSEVSRLEKDINNRVARLADEVLKLSKQLNQIQQSIDTKVIDK